ncbi:MAG TPA: DUF2809 domain-containing protein [Gemmatimonadaceae bacterium]|nr:DUF2809 domain-containing protein [Gemmatimonadaceae bacterium]
MPPRLRDRLAYVALAIGTIAIGLAVHLRGTALPPAARDVLGDALWAVMIAWGVSAVVPAAPRRVRGTAALAVCWAVELSQLYHAPLLDTVRATTAGHLVLGSGFDPRDLAAYAGGVVVAMLLDAAAGRRRRGAAQRPADARPRAAA